MITIYCNRLDANPLPDFQAEPLKTPMAIELNDEAVLKIIEQFYVLKGRYPNRLKDFETRAIASGETLNKQDKERIQKLKDLRGEE